MAVGDRSSVGGGKGGGWGRKVGSCPEATEGRHNGRVSGWYSWQGGAA